MPTKLSSMTVRAPLTRLRGPLRWTARLLIGGAVAPLAYHEPKIVP